MTIRKTAARRRKFAEVMPVTLVPKRRGPIEFATVTMLAALALVAAPILAPIVVLIVGLYVKDFFRDELPGSD